MLAEAFNQMGDEIQNPARDLPFAIYVAGAISLASYVLVTAAVLRLVPLGQLGVIQGVIHFIAPLVPDSITVDARDANNKYTAMPAYSGFPNTIKVTMRRDGKANGSLNLFFARALGASKADLTAAASATMYAGNINSFSISQMSAGILPVTYDVNHWNNFVKTGRDPDGIISVAADGNPELRIYPSLKAPGNFGELSLDDSHTGASTTTGWINNGVSASDVQALTNNGVIPLAVSVLAPSMRAP